MAYFQAINNRKVITKFDNQWDIDGMRAHPEYIEVTKDGQPVGKPKSEQRADWEMPVTRLVAGKGKKK